jgi:hypothetical protein
VVSSDTRLAVISATAPPSKTSLALAMSIRDVSTGVPTAWNESRGLSTRPSTRSMSWIIRSSTTPTSVPRGPNGASRSDSRKRGSSRCGRAPRTAGLYRSTWPTAILSPRRSARSTRSSASSRVPATGFSTRTWQPASRAARATGWWSEVGTATTRASTRVTSSASEAWCRVPVSPATRRPRSPSMSWTPPSRAPSRSVRIRACSLPSRPTPATPTETAAGAPAPDGPSPLTS